MATTVTTGTIPSVLTGLLKAISNAVGIDINLGGSKAFKLMLETRDDSNTLLMKATSLDSLSTVTQSAKRVDAQTIANMVEAVVAGGLATRFTGVDATCVSGTVASVAVASAATDVLVAVSKSGKHASTVQYEAQRQSASLVTVFAHASTGAVNASDVGVVTVYNLGAIANVVTKV